MLKKKSKWYEERGYDDVTVDICFGKTEMEKDKLAFPKWKNSQKFIFSISARGCGGISDDPYQPADKNELYYKISVFFDIFRFSPLTP